MYWFQCPKCGASGSIDEEQAEGRVSIVCECGMHRTGKVRPLILDTAPAKRDAMPSFSEDGDVTMPLAEPTSPNH